VAEAIGHDLTALWALLAVIPRTQTGQSGKPVRALPWRAITHRAHSSAVPVIYLIAFRRASSRCSIAVALSLRTNQRR
jgi:hypothetical protein